MTNYFVERYTTRFWITVVSFCCRYSVVFFNNNDEKLETEELQLFFDKDSMYTDKFVKISTKDGVIIGKKLISNLNFTKYRILTITDSYYNIEVDEENGEQE